MDTTRGIGILFKFLCPTIIVFLGVVNVLGLNSPLNLNEVRKLVDRLKIHIVCLELSNIMLMELWTSCYGIFFTWDNNRGGKDFIAEKLDMVMFNQWWLSAFPQCLVEYLIPIISYHSPGGKDFIAKRLDMVMFDQWWIGCWFSYFPPL